jgi:type IV pilus assembly protein PilA
MKTLQKGFTLIELMIVVAIIAILAAIAIPAYQDYVIRSQVSEGMTLADGSKTAMAEFYTNYGHFPTGSPGANTSVGLAAPGSIVGKYVSGVDVGTTQGKITVTFSNVSPRKASDRLTGKVLVLSSITGAGSVTWHCSSTAGTTVPQKYLPSSCRGAGQ